MDGEGMRLYLCGPITGRESEAPATFSETAGRLRDAGFEVVNPCETCPAGMARPDAMRVDIPELMACDGLALMPGWRDSKGCQCEFSIADVLGMEIRDVSVWLIWAKLHDLGAGGDGDPA